MSLTELEPTPPTPARLLQGQNQVLEAIARGEPLARTLDLLVRLIESQSRGMLCSILLLDDDGLTVHHGAAPHLPHAYIKAIDGQKVGPKAGSCGTAAHRGEPVIVTDIATDPLWEDYRALALQYGLRACWSTPIFDERRGVIGTFAQYFEEPKTPQKYHYKLVEIGTHLATIAIGRQKVEDELRRRERQLADSERIAHVGSFEWVIPTNTVHRSQELHRIFGLKPSECFKPTFDGYLERVHPDDRENIRASILTAYRALAPYEVEERIVRPDGEVRTLHSRGDWTLDEHGKPIRLIGICQDITEHKKADVALQEYAATLTEEARLKDEFLAMLGHELRNPLLPIRSAVMLLRRGANTPELHAKTYDVIERQLTHMSRLLDDLLDISRITRGRITLKVAESIDLRAIIAEAVDNVRDLITARRHHLQLELPDTPSLIRGDHTRLVQVVVNLLHNAAKYTDPEGQIHLTIAPEEGTAVLRVRDNGSGISPRILPKIFDLFTQDERKLDRSQGGLGIGLTLVRQITELHGGTVEAHSEGRDKGSEFIVRLPLLAAGAASLAIAKPMAC